MPQLLPLSLTRRRPGRINPGLDTIREAARCLGDPQETASNLRIAGTNGKGSTAAMLDAILTAHGVATGLYTSPHLVRVTERIRAGGREIPRDDLERLLGVLDEHPGLTFFETLTLAAFLWFRETRVGAAILEVGLGGRWDATRIAPCAVAGLTNVGSDHARWLGNTPEEVAAEKGAALAEARLAVVGPGVAPDLLPALGVPRLRPARDLVRLRVEAAGRVSADWGHGPVSLAVPLPGVHQVQNLHLALAMAAACVETGLLDRLDPGAVDRGLRAVRWPGRLSEHRIAGRRVLLDGAHNREAAEALSRELAGRPERFSLLFSCLDDKPLEAMAAALAPVVEEVAVFPLEDPRAMPLERLVDAFPGARPAHGALAALRALEDPVVAAGSLRVVGALLEYAEDEREEPSP